MLFHLLHTHATPPAKFNNPFYYEPHELCLMAAAEVQNFIAKHPADDVNAGKMFGVLVVRGLGDSGEQAGGEPPLGYLAAYSGQLEDGTAEVYHREFGFVPAVFDYLQPDGYFKHEESLISGITADIQAIEGCDELQGLLSRLTELRAEADRAIGERFACMREAKQRRDERRKEGFLSAAEQREMVRESQFLKAEWHRAKQQYRQQIATVEAAVGVFDSKVQALKNERKRRSDALQAWLFAQFKMLNGRGECRSLPSIFASTTAGVPPSGAGECCEPKLLQYAFAHSMQPLCMAMFWWGASPKEEIRHHLHYYPACQGKCKPIMQWMLQGISVEENPLERDERQSLEVLYEDASLIVVNKPAGMLSVPGKSKRQSVLSIVRDKCRKAVGPMVVHRLDMATSGILVLAKDMASYIHLQRQFREHTIYKRYIAVLSHPQEVPIPHAVASHAASGDGTCDGVWHELSLPLRADSLNRPYQRVDREHGKQAITRYRFVAEDRVELCPLTGRTHQLRVHCAHSDGLNNPIKGDTLYGKAADRLYLQAVELHFEHPVTGERMCFKVDEEF